jgi:antitoxin YefM
MSRQVTYSYARQNLAEVLNEAEEGQAPIIITRRDHEDVAVIPATELRSLEETAHLLRSPKNAQRLLSALKRALEDSVEPETTKQLRAELGLP